MKYFSIQKLKRFAVGASIALSFVVVISFIMSGKKMGELETQSQIESHFSKLGKPYRPNQVLRYSDATKRRGEELIQTGSKALSRRAQDFLGEVMKDESVKYFFNYTLEFFGPNPGAFAAARFVAFTMIFNSGLENTELMMWTKRGLADHSEDLMKTLESRAHDIDANPFFHNRMLNLAHALNVKRERKVSFYAETLSQPLVVLKNGALDESSVSFEVALILAQQSAESPSVLAPAIHRALSVNTNIEARQALRQRVLAYYPELSYLF